MIRRMRPNSSVLEEVLKFSFQHLWIAANMQVPLAELAPIVDSGNPTTPGVMLRLRLVVLLSALPLRLEDSSVRAIPR